VPADAFVFDRVFEAVLVVIEACGSGFHFNKDDFFYALRVHAFEDQEVDRRPDEFGFGRAEGKVGEVGRELLGEHAAQYRTRALYGFSLCFGKFIRGFLFSDEFADFVHEEKCCREKQGDNDDPNRGERGHAGMVAWRGAARPGMEKKIPTGAQRLIAHDSNTK